VKEAAKKKEKKEEEAKKEEAKKEPEATFEILQNPARVMRQQVRVCPFATWKQLQCLFWQLKVLQMSEGCTYIPVKELSIGGIIMVRQAQPNAPEELVEPVAGTDTFICYQNKKK
jgi:26S proteasome regulatory subunit N2